MADRLVRAKTVYQASGTSLTATFAESTALDNTYLLVAVVSLSSSTVIATPSGWTALSGNGSNGTNQVRTFIKQGDGSTNGVTLTVTSTTATLVLAAFSGYLSLTPLSATGANAGASETSQAITFPGSPGGYGVGLAIVGVAGTVTWGSVTNGTRIGASTGSSALANASQLLSVAEVEFTGALTTTTTSWTTSRTPRYMTVVLPLSNPPTASVPYVASAGTPVSGSASTLSVPVPAGVTSGDLVIIALGAEWNSTTLPTTASVTSSGFTVAQIAAFQSYTNYAETNFLLYKYATAADTGNYSIVFGTVNGGSVTAVAGAAAIIRNGPTSGNPFVDTFQLSHSVGSQSVSVSSFTPSAANTLLIGSVWCNDGVSVSTQPTGWQSQANGAGGNGIMISTLQQASASATGTLGWTMASGSPDPVVLIGSIRASAYTPPPMHIFLNFDEGSGTTVHDTSGNGNDFTLDDTTRWTASGKTNGGLGYGANAGYAYRGLTSDIATANLPFTVMMWVKPANTTQSDAGLIGNLALDLEYESGHFYGDGFGTTSATYPASTWTHVAWVADGTNKITYVNGVNVLSVAGAPPGGWANTNYIGVGGTDDTNNFNGVIDDVRIFKSALTAIDINYFMNLSTGVTAQWYVKTSSSLVPLSPYLLSSGGLVALGAGAIYSTSQTYNFPSNAGLTVGSATNDGAAGGGLALGEIISVLQAGLTATGVRWWTDTTANGMHAIGRLWDAGTGAVLAQSPLTTLATGWNTLSFTTPYSLISGNQVIAGVFLASGEAIYTQTTSGSVSRSTAQFSIASGGSRYEYSASAALSATDGGNDTWYGIDIIATSS